MKFQRNRKVLIPAVLCLVILGIASDSASAFLPSKSTSAVPVPARVSSSKVTLQAGVVPTTAETIQEMANARFAFGMCFYGALGIGSIGRELIPIVFGRYQTTSSLESDGTMAVGSRGTVQNDDDDLGIWGYPEQIYRKDVEMILNNPLTPLAIAKKYPIEKDEDADKRYTYTHMTESVPFLGYDGFVKANPRANPVALRAVFDSFSNSIGGSNAVSPITAQGNIDLYLNNKAVTGELAKKLNGGKSIGISAFVFLLALLGIGDALAIFHLWKGWFPEWQGFSDMPSSLFDQNIGITVLPNFFVGDVPPIP